jgi:hypothetical protein
MPPQGTPPRPGKGPATAKTVGGAALTAAASTAAGLLSDPKVREQLLEFGAGLTDTVRTRAAERKAARTDGDDAGPRSHALRQRRLEHRADKLAGNVGLLVQAPGQESTDALERVAEVVGRVRLALAVANNLPLRRRIAAQREIATVLAKLENAVLDATMPDDGVLPPR